MNKLYTHIFLSLLFVSASHTHCFEKKDCKRILKTSILIAWNSLKIFGGTAVLHNCYKKGTTADIESQEILIKFKNKEITTFAYLSSFVPQILVTSFGGGIIISGLLGLKNDCLPKKWAKKIESYMPSLD